MYNLYKLIVYLILPLALLAQFFKGFRNSDYWLRWGERLGHVPQDVKQNAPYDVWLHAVSVGEVRAAIPLIKKLLETSKKSRILITTMTPTGSDMVKMSFNDSVSHCYLPYDTSCSMQRFVEAIRPKRVIVMETEIWPNLIHTVKQLGASLVYVNVRLSERSYKKYAKVKSFARSVIDKIDLLAVQGETDAKHLKLLGIDDKKLHITGSIKFDVNMPASLHESAEVLRRQLGQDRLIWIAGSTRDGEEGYIIEAYKKLKTFFPSLLLILVPRHPERFDTVARKVKRHDLKLKKRSEHQTEIKDDVDVYLGDTMGELSVMYAASDVAFVGGSLVPFGGQNILEPCALGKPVLFGPHMFNFLEISRLVISAKAGSMIKNTEQLSSQLYKLLANPNERDQMGSNGKQLIEQHRGALERIYKLLG